MAGVTTYTREVAALICQRMADGESLRQICRDESMPCLSTVLKWSREIPEFSQHYAQAREALLEHWAEEINEIADDGSNDWVRRETAQGRVEIVVDAEHIARSRLRVDTRKWLLSKLLPKRFGDSTEVTLNGTIGTYAAQPIPVEQRDSDALESTARPAVNGHSPGHN
jgi:hypothetical protein